MAVQPKGNTISTPFSLMRLKIYFLNVYYLGPTRSQIRSRLYHWEGEHPEGIETVVEVKL